MFGWLLPWRKRRVDPDRLVFRFKDGTRKRYADPIVVERGLMEVLGRDWRAVIRDLAKPAPLGLVGEQREEAESKNEELRAKVLGAVVHAFDVLPFHDDNGTMVGLTEVEMFDLLGGFVRFCNDLMRIARPFVNARSRASPSPESSPPASGSDSTSTVTTSPTPEETTSPAR